MSADLKSRLPSTRAETCQGLQAEGRRRPTHKLRRVPQRTGCRTDHCCRRPGVRTTARRCQPCTHAWRLGVIRTFAAWLRVVEPTAGEPIPKGLIRANYQRVTPYLYTPAQVGQLMAAARKLRERYLADATYVLIGLLYVTGLRSGEAFGLDVEDLDRSRLVLSVRESSTASVWCPSTRAPRGAARILREPHDRAASRGSNRAAPQPDAAHAAFRRVLAACDLDPSGVPEVPGCTTSGILWRSTHSSKLTAKASTSTLE